MSDGSNGSGGSGSSGGGGRLGVDNDLPPKYHRGETSGRRRGCVQRELWVNRLDPMIVNM